MPNWGLVQVYIFGKLRTYRIRFYQLVPSKLGSISQKVPSKSETSHYNIKHRILWKFHTATTATTATNRVH